MLKYTVFDTAPLPFTTQIVAVVPGVTAHWPFVPLGIGTVQVV